MGMNLLIFIKKLPNKDNALHLMLFGFLLIIFCINSFQQISLLGFIWIMMIYSIYVILHVYIISIVNNPEMDRILLNKDMKLDVIFVRIGYSFLSDFFIIIVVVFFTRNNGFNQFKSYIYFIIFSLSMLIVCLSLIISLIRLCYITEFELSIFEQLFLIIYLVIFCILSFAILNTSFNCIDIEQEKVIIQDDYFIDYIYRYTCIFTLQYNSSENLSTIDKVLNIIALIYSYTFVATIVGLATNFFNIKKKKTEPESHAKNVYVCPQKASAGIGKIKDDTNPDLKIICFEDIFVPPGTTHGIILDGHSMEDKFFDKQIVFIQNGLECAAADCGIFSVTDNHLETKIYCKQLMQHNDGSKYLHSVNTKKGDPDIDYKNVINVHCIGKILT